MGDLGARKRRVLSLGHPSAEGDPFRRMEGGVGGQAGSTSQHFSHLAMGPVSVSYLLGWPNRC
jgi:hypothetical protein